MYSDEKIDMSIRLAKTLMLHNDPAVRKAAHMIARLLEELAREHLEELYAETLELR